VPAGSVIGPEPYGEPNTAIITYARNPDPYDGQVYNGGGRPIDLRRPARTLLASMGGNKTPWVDTLGVVPEYHRHLLAGGVPRSGRVPGARRITVAEAARLQTFLDGMRFCGLAVLTIQPGRERRATTTGRGYGPSFGEPAGLGECLSRA
jgi:DNA (cytosine-5)-methyltransferase 1